MGQEKEDRKLQKALRKAERGKKLTAKDKQLLAQYQSAQEPEAAAPKEAPAAAEAEEDAPYVAHVDVAGYRLFDVAAQEGGGSDIHISNFALTAGGKKNLFKQAELRLNSGRKYGLIMRTVQADWRWLNRDVHGKYDAVIVLGNSFTHLLDERDRRKALAEFYAALKHDGILILDQRNYDRILDKGFSSKHKYYYCGDQVSAEPEHVDDGLARFCYSFPDGSQYHLNMFPLRKDYTRGLMKDVGFQKIETFGDFKETHREEEPDFYIHVAYKDYHSGDEEA